MSNIVLSRVEVAAIEGRARNLRGRQAQLTSLFNYLNLHQDDFVEAVKVEESCSLGEAQLVVAALLLDLRKHYNRLDLKQELASEYSIKHGKSCPSRRVPVRIVYIIPDTIHLAFSVFSAISGAIEAGTCCIVEISNTLQKSAELVRLAISEALERDTFAVVSSRAPPEFLAQCVVVDQIQQLKSSIVTLGHLISSTTLQVSAIVDRTGNVRLAAKEVVSSRLAFGAKGPYRVDQVFVNEFVAEKFMDALVEELTLFQSPNKKTESANGKVINPSQHRGETEDKEEQQLTQDGLRENSCQVIRTDGLTTVVEVSTRSSPLLHRKVVSKLVVVHKISSLDDAIDVHSASSQPLNALYIFAAPPEAKYLSQYISSRVTFVNHIPTQLLVGPAFTAGFPPQIDLRYTVDMFTEPSPQFVPGERLHPISVRVPHINPPGAAQLLKAMSKPLKPTGQGPAGAWGFFEQAIALGAVVYLLPTIVFSVAGIAFATVLTYRRLMPA